MASRSNPNTGLYANVEDVQPGWLVNAHPYTATVRKVERNGKAARLYLGDGRMVSRRLGHQVRVFSRSPLKNNRKAKK